MIYTSQHVKILRVFKELLRIAYLLKKYVRNKNTQTKVTFGRYFVDRPPNFVIKRTPKPNKTAASSLILNLTVLSFTEAPERVSRRVR